MKNKLIVMTAALVLATSGAIAQTTSNQTAGDNESLDTVILTSNANYPDAVISSSPSEKLGLPVLLTNPDNLSESATQFMQEENVSKVVIVGGEAVVSEEVQSEAEDIANNTVRLWDNEASGTSIDVANYFWPEETDEATIIQAPIYENMNEGYQISAAAANAAEEEPLYITSEEEIPQNIVSELDRRNIDEVDLYTQDASNAEQTLEQANVDVTVTEGTPDEIQEQVHNDTESVSADQTLVTVAGENFENGLPAYAVPTPTTYIVTADSVEEYTQFVNDTEFERTMVIGEQELSNTIVERSQELNMTAAPFNGEDSAEVAASLASNTSDTWVDLQNDRYAEWQEEVNTSQEAEDTVDYILERSNTIMEQLESEEVENYITNAETFLEEDNIFSAHESAFRALSEAKILAYEENQTVSDTNETENDTAQDNTTQDNMTDENATENDTAGGITGAQNDTQDNMTEDNTTETNQTEENETEVDSSTLNITTEGDEIVVDATYMADNDNYIERITTTQENENIEFVFELISSDEADGEQNSQEYMMQDSIQVETQQDYEVTSELRVDNETVNQTERTVTLS